MNISEITDYLEGLAPLSSQEGYDNSGLIVGDPNTEVDEVLVTLDCIEDTIQEAIDNNIKFVIAHHPIVFKGLKKFNGRTYVERTVMKAIKHDIAIYAIHTNFDNYLGGVNREIADRIGVANAEILAPKQDVLNKVVCYVPEDSLGAVKEAMFKAGAGNIGDYEECSFSVTGEGTFMPKSGANPFEGEVGKLSKVSEHRLEVLVSSHSIGQVLNAMKEAHPYEEVAHEVYAVMNVNQQEGAGMIGEIDAVDEKSFLSHLKQTFNCGVIRHTKLLGKDIKKVAFCGGSGSFLLKDAIKAGADIFITGDFKYHEFFDAEDKIIIADIGHFESEQFTSNKLAAVLTKKFPKFAVRLTEVNTNPINYF